MPLEKVRKVLSAKAPIPLETPISDEAKQTSHPARYIIEDKQRRPARRPLQSKPAETTTRGSGFTSPPLRSASRECGSGIGE